MKSKITKEEEENLKEMARTMLIAGKKAGKIVEETGLPIRVVWGLKGDLAKSGKIPMKAELKKLKRADPGSSHVILERILNEFGVKERAKEIIINRYKRVGGMYPSELNRCLIDLDTGLDREKANYITEEYYLAIPAEGGPWTMRGRELELRGAYVGRYPRRVRPTLSQYEWGYDRNLYGRPLERSNDYIKERIINRLDDLVDILDDLVVTLPRLLKYLR